MNVLDDNEDIFQLPNTEIATWLKINHVEHIGTNTSEFPALHRFQNPKDGTIGKLLADWEAGRADGNCKTYYKTYRELVTLAKKANSLLD